MSNSTRGEIHLFVHSFVHQLVPGMRDGATIVCTANPSTSIRHPIAAWNIFPSPLAHGLPHLVGRLPIVNVIEALVSPAIALQELRHYRDWYVLWERGCVIRLLRGKTEQSRQHRRGYCVGFCDFRDRVLTRIQYEDVRFTVRSFVVFEMCSS